MDDIDNFISSKRAGMIIGKERIAIRVELLFAFEAIALIIVKVREKLMLPEATAIRKYPA